MSVETAVIKTEAHTKKIEPEYQGIALADFYEKAAATQSIRVVDHVDEVHSVPAKNDPCCQTFAILVSLQQATACFLGYLFLFFYVDHF